MRVPERPVIAGFHPDPSICRVGDDYYLVNSSFEYSPGVPIFHSTNLTQWTLIGHVLDRPEQLLIEGAVPSGGVYAPSLRHHDGQFWMITTNQNDGPGQLLVTATAPVGAWSEPVHIRDAHGIDPDLTWDENGTCWLSWSGAPRAGEHAILQAPLDPSTGQLLAAPAVLWRGTGGQYPEGPHLYRHDGYWYLLIAEGGTERGHTVTVARATNITGPFEPAPANPLLSARSTDWPVQNTGHADFVERADGSWALVFLGVRARGSTPAWHVLGRETFAAELTWEGGWPYMGAPIEPPAATVVVEELDGVHVPASWAAASTWRDDALHHDRVWHLRAARGDEVFAGRRQEQFFTTTQARLVNVEGEAGLEVRIDPHHRLTLRQTHDQVQAVFTVGDLETVLGSASSDPESLLELRTEPGPHDAGTRRGPDLIVAGVRTGSDFTELGRVDGRYVSTEVAGGFTGRFIGVVTRGEVSIGKFRYTGSDDYERLS